VFSSEHQRLTYIKHFAINVNKTLLLRPIVPVPIAARVGYASSSSIKKKYIVMVSEKKDIEFMTKLFIKQLDQVTILQSENQELLSEEDIHPFKQIQSEKDFEKYHVIVSLHAGLDTITLLEAVSNGCIPLYNEDPLMREFLPFYTKGSVTPSADEMVMLARFRKQLEEIESCCSDKEMISVLRTHVKKIFNPKKTATEFLTELEKRVRLYKEFVREEYPLILKKSLNFYSNSNNSDTKDPFQEFGDQFPDMNEYYSLQISRGVCFYKQKQYDQARACFKTCVSLKDDFQNNVNLALLEEDCNNKVEFLRYAEKALSMKYDFQLANKIALMYHHVDFHKAQYYYRRILQVNPCNVMALINVYELYFVTKTLEHCLYDLKSKSVLNELKDQMKLALLESIRTHNLHGIYGLTSNMIMSQLYLEGISEEDLSKYTRETIMMIPKRVDLIKIVARLNRFKKHDKVRLGYLLSDLKPHPVGFLLRLILENTVFPNEFEIIVYDNKNTENQVFKAVKAMPHIRVKELHETDEEALQQIVDDDLDILVDMMGFTQSNRIQLLQYKPARIVASYFAFPYTTGIKEIDYKITDAYASPEFTQINYVEKLYRLPGCLQCFATNEDATKRYDTRTNPFTIHLCCFNNPRKFTPTVFRAFARILIMAPYAKLFLRYVTWYNCSFYTEAIYCIFMRMGVAREQIDISINMDRFKYFDGYNDMDLALDPFPYNGGITSHEALYMNTPLICMEGQDYRSRIGVSLLSQLGLEEYIAQDVDDYVQKTLDLIDSNNRDKLLKLHKNLRFMMQQRDMSDPARFTRNVEEAFIKMKKKYFTDLSTGGSTED
jgi:predicted O-linked N-acetylglucosamine transferase (SPINDLY family)